jgi:PAS domain S-box-containing protein
MTGIENPSNPIILSVHHAIIMMDVKGQIAYWNKEAEELFGWTSEEVIGKNLHTLLMPEQYREDFTKGFDEFRLSGRGDVINKTIELTAKHRDGYEFPVEVSLGIVPIMDTWYAIGVVKDVARKKHLEFQLSHADKMESIGTLAAGIAHDFNNILSSIIGYTELAMDDTVEDTLIHSNLTEVITAANRARDLVRQLLKFSRQTETVPEPVHVKSVVIEAMKLIRASFPSTIDIRMNINSDGLVMASYTQLHQIILNLCTNAGHAMEE